MAAWRMGAAQMALGVLVATPCLAADPTELPDELRALLTPVQIDWSQVYPGLVPSPDDPDPVATALKPVRLRTEGLSLVGRLRAMLAKGEVTEETFPQWATQHHIDTPTLIAALDEIPLWHPMDTVYLPISRALWQRIGDNLDEYREFPYRARITMGIYLGVLEREADAKELLSSVPEEWQRQDPTVPLYHVANELVDSRRKSPALAIWAWKRGATALGPREQAFVCWHIQQTCRRLGDAHLVRTELIPWAEQALGRLTSKDGRYWHHALWALIWAYEWVGGDAGLVERADYWVKQATQLGVEPGALLKVKVRLAGIHRARGRAQQAENLLRAVVASAPAGSWAYVTAQGELLEMLGPDAGQAAKAPSSLGGVCPSDLSLHVRIGERLNRPVTVRGSADLMVTRVECTTPFVRAIIGERTVRQAASFQTIDLRAEPTGRAANLDGILSIETNDPQAAHIELPVRITATEAIRPQPARLFFGFVRPGETKRATVQLASTMPFEIVAVVSDRPQAMAVKVTRSSDRLYLIEASLQAPENEQAIEGDVLITTSLPIQESLNLAYYAQVDKTAPQIEMASDE